MNRAGLEPATYCLEGSCSIQLSYRSIQAYKKDAPFLRKQPRFSALSLYNRESLDSNARVKLCSQMSLCLIHSFLTS